MNAGSEKGEAFQQALNVGVGTDFLGLLVEGQAASNLGEFAGELAGGFAQMAEFGVVEVKESLIHCCRLP